MKKIFSALILGLLLYTCQKSDDQMVAICDVPEQVSIGTITNTSVEISWSSDVAATSYVLEYGSPGFELGTGTTVTSNTNNVTINGLQAHSSYEIYVKAFCDQGNISMLSEMATFNTKTNPIATDFMATLSQMNIYIGDMANLTINPLAFEYEISTPLFTDYANKQRIMAIPENMSMVYVDDLLPALPDDTVVFKTFYYNADDRDPALGKTIIETRVLIKKNGIWELGNYIWNSAQNEAVLDANGSTVPISFIDSDGNTTSMDYAIPSAQQCITCHQNNGTIIPIGPKMRTMNFMVDGMNQLQYFINKGHLTGISNANDVQSLPDWSDASLSLEQRSRAYFEVNCAHCHSPGGYFDVNYYSFMDLRYETPFADAKIYEMRNNIVSRMEAYMPGYSMPFIGTTMTHAEGYTLISAFIDTL